MTRALAILSLAGLAASQARADFIVPGSGSPDGKTALYYRAIPNKQNYQDFEFYFRDRKSLRPLSGQLVPDMQGKVIGTDPATIDDDETAMLLESISEDIDATLSGQPRDRAFSYYFSWSRDSKWVSLQGGAHKFWHLTAYHFTTGHCQHLTLPEYGAFVNYYRERAPHLRIKRLGALRKLTMGAKDGPAVCWTGNGRLAVDSYPYLLLEDDYDKMIYGQEAILFLLNCETQPTSTILGFCR